MSKTLEEIRKKIQAMDYKKSSNSRAIGDKTVYPHWNIPEGTSAIVRFLPDGNEDNTFFWVEKQVIKLTFPGIKGHDENKEVSVQVPCIEMWEGKNTCPILNEVRPLWKANDKDLEETARKYWVKRTYYAQGFVKQDPLGETDAPENPIRKFNITPQIFALIKATLLDPDMENSPVDYINGTDFIISKTSKGGHADYTTSKWARKESSLTEDMMEAINQYGLADLSSYLPKKPTPEHLAAMFEMFQASLDGELYDPDRWSKFYKPYGMDSVNDDVEVDEDSAKPAKASKVALAKASSVIQVKKPPVVEEDTDSDDDSEETEEETPTTKTVKESTAGTKSPQEILAMLRNRNK